MFAVNKTIAKEIIQEGKMEPSYTSDVVNLLASIKSMLESNGVDVSLECLEPARHSKHLKASYYICIYNGRLELVGRIKLHAGNLILITRGETHTHAFSLHDSRVIENIVKKVCRLSKG